MGRWSRLNKESLPWRHCVVEDGVDSWVDIEHQPGEVEEVEVDFAV